MPTGGGGGGGPGAIPGGGGTALLLILLAGGGTSFVLILRGGGGTSPNASACDIMGLSVVTLPNSTLLLLSALPLLLQLLSLLSPPLSSTITADSFPIASAFSACAGR
jgi:hypothetical protein